MPLEIESETRVSANMDRNTNRLLLDFRWDFRAAVANVGPFADDGVYLH